MQHYLPGSGALALCETGSRITVEIASVRACLIVRVLYRPQFHPAVWLQPRFEACSQATARGDPHLTHSWYPFYYRHSELQWRPCRLDWPDWTGSSKRCFKCWRENSLWRYTAAGLADAVGRCSQV